MPLPGGLPSRNDRAPPDGWLASMGGTADAPTVQLDWPFSTLSKSPLVSESLTTQPSGTGVVTGCVVATGGGVPLGWGGAAVARRRHERRCVRFTGQQADFVQVERGAAAAAVVMHAELDAQRAPAEVGQIDLFELPRLLVGEP